MNRIIKKVTAGFDRLLLFLHKRRTGIIIGLEAMAVLFLLTGWFLGKKGISASATPFSGNLFSIFHREEDASAGKNAKDFIKWVDFDVTSEAMTQAFRYDVATCQQDIHLNWTQLLSYLGARYGGDFSRYSSSDMDKLAEQLKNGTSMDELTKDLKYYSYYLEAYNAVLGGMVGYYEIQIPQSEAPAFALSDTQINEGDPGAGGSEGESPDSAGNQAPSVEPLTPAGEQKVWVTKYGLKAFHPLAKNFPYSHYDDFGVSRSYGYRRQHLGHDMMGLRLWRSNPAMWRPSAGTSTEAGVWESEALIKNDIIIMPICARITHIRQTLKKAASSPPEISLDILDGPVTALRKIQIILMNPTCISEYS